MLFSWSLVSPAFGQEADGLKKIKPLQIGDTIPEELWHVPLNLLESRSGNRQARLADFKGQYIILDFLTTGCPSCIEALPKLRQLQDRFDPQLAIIPVSPEREDRVVRFWKTNLYARSADLPIVIEDRLLKAYFPHRYISHLVWIDKGGKVCGFTSTSFFAERTIRQFMEGAYQGWPVKTETTSFFSRSLCSFNFLEPNTVLRNKGILDDWVWLSGYIQGVGPLADKCEGLPEGYYWISYRNRPPIHLIRIALDLRYTTPIDYRGVEALRFDVAARDSHHSTPDEWDMHHAICYERPIPVETSDKQWKAILLKDICSYMDIEVLLTMTDGKQRLIIKPKEN